ncbi:MAG TPA: isochorismatase family protein [Syntrophorhabdaceae bacterium]|nr:isochorismatase family protein [Syntrophorhabdaceae bacterium]HPP06665.1 isochorismatase family protein [Syntrophorhabdaceae bacterium]
MNRYGLIKREDCIIVLIDLQERLMPAIYNREKVMENAIRLVRFSKIVNIPVIITEQEKLGKTMPELKNELKEAMPVTKIHFNCFENETFLDLVKRHKRETLIIAGVEAHICVAQTALSRISDYNVHVIEDAISSRVESNCRAAIERMRQAGVIISTTEMVIYEILKKAGTEEFKACLSLIK